MSPGRAPHHESGDYRHLLDVLSRVPVTFTKRDVVHRSNRFTENPRLLTTLLRWAIEDGYIESEGRSTSGTRYRVLRRGAHIPAIPHKRNAIRSRKQHPGLTADALHLIDVLAARGLAAPGSVFTRRDVMRHTNRFTRVPADLDKALTVLHQHRLIEPTVVVRGNGHKYSGWRVL